MGEALTGERKCGIINQGSSHSAVDTYKLNMQNWHGFYISYMMIAHLENTGNNFHGRRA